VEWVRAESSHPRRAQKIRGEKKHWGSTASFNAPTSWIELGAKGVKTKKRVLGTQLKKLNAALRAGGRQSKAGGGQGGATQNTVRGAKGSEKEIQGVRPRKKNSSRSLSVERRGGPRVKMGGFQNCRQ